MAYDDAWQIKDTDFPHEAPRREKHHFLLRYAILAPSSHNSQPWKFAVSDEEIRLLVDTTCWLKIADREKRELYISAGCALENLIIAAEHFGFEYTVCYFPIDADDAFVASVGLTPDGNKGNGDDLFGAIPLRQTNHKRFGGERVAEGHLARLKSCCTEKGVDLYLTGDSGIKRRIDELVVRADAIQFADPAFRDELAYWIGQGAFGTPWLLAKLSEFAVRHINIGKTMSIRDTELLMSAPIFGLITTTANSRLCQIKTGQVFERLYLMATRLGLGVQPISQIMQIANVRDEIPAIVPIQGRFPQQPFRLGYAEAGRTHTPRRPLETFLL